MNKRGIKRFFTELVLSGMRLPSFARNDKGGRAGNDRRRASRDKNIRLDFVNIFSMSDQVNSDNTLICIKTIEHSPISDSQLVSS